MDLAHEKRLTEVEDRAQSNSHRIDELEKRQDNLDDLAASVKLLAYREENVEKDVKEIKSDVKSLTGKSGKMFDTIVEKIILCIITAIVVYLLAKVGL